MRGQVSTACFIQLVNITILQVLNLKSALEQRKSPWELVHMPPVTIERVKIGRARRFIQHVRSRPPFFQWC